MSRGLEETLFYPTDIETVMIQKFLAIARKIYGSKIDLNIKVEGLKKDWLNELLFLAKLDKACNGQLDFSILDELISLNKIVFLRDYLFLIKTSLKQTR